MLRFLVAGVLHQVLEAPHRKRLWDATGGPGGSQSAGGTARLLLVISQERRQIAESELAPTGIDRVQDGGVEAGHGARIQVGVAVRNHPYLAGRTKARRHIDGRFCFVDFGHAVDVGMRLHGATVAGARVEPRQKV